MKSLAEIGALMKSWAANKWILFPSLAVVSVTVAVLVVTATQPSIISDALTPGGSSSSEKENDKDSLDADSGEAGNEASPSASASPSSSSSPSNSNQSPSSGGSTSSSPEATPFVESAAQAEAREAAAVYLTQDYQYPRPLFSRLRLAEMLRDDGYSSANATYAAGAVSHDWSAEAELVANDLVSEGSYSRSGLIAELRSENFTSSEASFAAGQLESSYPDGFYWSTIWLDQASTHLSNEITSGSYFSEVEANQFLRAAGFTTAEVSAVLAADYTEDSWRYFAEWEAFEYFYVPEQPTLEQVRSYLAGRGFTQSQIDYAISRL